MRAAIIRQGGTIAPHVVQGYIDALRALGHETAVVSRTANLKGELEHIRPDFVLAYSFAGMVQDEEGFVLRNLKIPLLSLHYDNPLFNLHNIWVKEFRKYPEYYYHFIWDKMLLRLMADRGLSNCYPIMLAVNPAVFPYAAGPPSIRQSCFVGRIDNRPMPEADSPEIASFMRDVIQMKKKRIDLPAIRIVKSLLEGGRYLSVRDMFSNRPTQFWKGVYFPIHAIGSAELRAHVLGKLKRPIHIYGSTERTLAGCTQHSQVPYKLSAQVYHTYAIHINVSSIQLEEAVNNRIFDGFAAGGFVLSDYRRDLRQLFPGLWKAVTYHSIYELRSKIDYYLSHPKERAELSGELRRQIMKHHTYEQRVKAILANVYDA